jgi:molecular chaperone DnaK
MGIVGIDLGTTNSSIAEFDDSGNVRVIHNVEGKNITPSVVWITDSDKKTIKVGDEAKNVIGIEQNVYFEFKREIGKPTRYSFFDTDISPTDLSAFVLQKLKSDYENTYNTIDTVVITVPANFANEQREATLTAARIAGFKTQLLVNEPTAAALYYTYSDNKLGDGSYMVFDLGGGTFDVSIVNVNGNDIVVLSSEGLQKCGGADFDNAIIEIIKEKFQSIHNTELDLSKSNISVSTAESLKMSLSSLKEKKINIMCEGFPSTEIVLTRNEFEKKISTYLTQMKAVCENALADCDKSINDISNIFLAGGSSRIPAVQEMLEKFHKKKPLLKGNPDEAISLGAAIYAGLKTDNNQKTDSQASRLQTVNLQEISPAYFGFIAISTSELKEINSIIINKNVQIPCSVTESFFTINDNQTEVTLTITQSPVEETDPRFVRKIWEGILTVPENRPAGQQIDVTFSYLENGLMNASFVDIASNKKQEVDITAQSEGSDATIDIDDFLIE